MNLKKALCTLLLGAFAGMLGGCGGGGGAAAPTTTVSGVVSKGIFTGGVVAFYSLASDGTKTLITTGTIKPDGSYSTDLGKLVSGPILVEASGKYKDEANPTVEVTVDPATPLRAAVSTAAQATTVVVTPLTDVAVQKATAPDGSISATSINNANAAIANLFGVDNIVTTKPVAFDTTIMKAAKPAEQKYTEVLAMVSQYVANNAGAATPDALKAALPISLANLGSGITVSSTTAEVSSFSLQAGLTQAINDVTTNNAATSAVLTAVDTSAKTNLAASVNLGTDQIVAYPIVVGGISETIIRGVQADITIPSSFNVPAGQVTNGMLAPAVTGFIEGNMGFPSAGVMRVAFATTVSFTSGPFGKLFFKIPAADTPPVKEAFSVNGIIIKDAALNLLTGTVTIGDPVVIK